MASNLLICHSRHITMKNSLSGAWQYSSIPCLNRDDILLLLPRKSSVLILFLSMRIEFDVLQKSDLYLTIIEQGSLKHVE
jgi:hypothetical protein